MKTAFITDGFLFIRTGAGRYDINKSFRIDGIIELIEEVGVNGGHIGWQLKAEPIHVEYGYDFGRKHRNTMEEIKELIEDGKIKAKYTVLGNRPTKCY